MPPQEEKPKNIFDFGFGQDFNRAIESKSTGVVYDILKRAINTGQIFQGGILTLKALSVGGLVRQVAPGDSIQEAIEAVSRGGGGTVQLLADRYLIREAIQLKDNVILKGAGVTNTTIDFGDSVGRIEAVWDQSTQIQGFGISDMRVENSANADAGIYIEGGQLFTIRNVHTRFHSNDGMQIIGESELFSIENCISDDNQNNGFTFDDRAGDSMISYLVINCRALSNTGIGFNFKADNSTHNDFVVLGCSAETNDGDGFDISGGNVAMDAAFVGCFADSNGGIGFDIDTNDNSFLGCQADSNTGDGFEVSRTLNKFLGCAAASNGTDWDIQEGGAYAGCNLNGVSLDTTEDSEFQMVGNLDQEPLTYRKQFEMKNNSGQAIRQGNVLIYDPAVTPFDEVNLTTTASDHRVIGIVDGAASVSNGSAFRVLMEGRTTDVWVTNGTSSISLGDYLTTYSHSYFARKAESGEMAFAVATESPTTSTASIGAFLISPRTI